MLRFHMVALIWGIAVVMINLAALIWFTGVVIVQSLVHTLRWIVTNIQANPTTNRLHSRHLDHAVKGTPNEMVAIRNQRPIDHR